MNTGGITNRIFRFCNTVIGWIPGGLGHANVLASVVFAGMSGSAVADAAGLGSIEIKAMEDAGFDKGFSAAVTAASKLSSVQPHSAATSPDARQPVPVILLIIGTPFETSATLPPFAMTSVLPVTITVQL